MISAGVEFLVLVAELDLGGALRMRSAGDRHKGQKAANNVAFESIRGRDMTVLSMMADDTGRWNTLPNAMP